MPRTSKHRKEAHFNLRLDPALKEAFAAAAKAEHKPAEEVLRDFMHAYVARRDRRAFADSAQRDSLLIAERRRIPGSDEAQVMREIEADLSTPTFWAD